MLFDAILEALCAVSVGSQSHWFLAENPEINENIVFVTLCPKTNTLFSTTFTISYSGP